MRLGHACVVLAATLGGCAVNPTVRYAEATSPASVAAVAPRLIDSFYLQRNDVEIAVSVNREKGKDLQPELVVTNRRGEDHRHRIMLLRGDKAWTRTTISLTKLENTDLIETAGVEVEDRRVELLQAVGGVAKTLVALGGSAGFIQRADPLGCPDFPLSPCELKQPDELGIPKAGATLDTKQHLLVTWGPVPSSAVPSGTFFASLPLAAGNGLYYSACRSLRVELRFDDPKGEGEVHFVWRGRIADPDWIEFVAFPRKGSLRMHSQCGVSVTSEKDPTRPTDAIISEVLAQALAVKDAAKGN